MMRIVFWIFFVITGFLIVGACAGYRAMIYSHETHEGGDAFGPIGFFGLISMILLSFLSIISAIITLGLWISEKNNKKSKEHVLGIEQ